jgi:uncharacterized protein
MKKKTQTIRNKKSSRHNDMGLLSGVFDQVQGYGTQSAMSMPFQLGGSNQYNPISLNRILLNYAYMTFGIIQTFIDQPVEDALRGGVDIESGELEEADIKLLQDVLVELKDYEAVKLAMKWAKLFGGSGLIINTDQDPTTELDIDAVNESSPLSFIDADRWELTLNYYLEEKIPCPYNYYGQPIHRSRVLKVMGKDAPSFIRRRLQGWGMSELERTLRGMNSYTKNQEVIYALLDEAKQDIWMIENLNSKLATSQGQTLIQQRLELANRMKNYSNAIIMDKMDAYDQKQLSFGGLADMQNQNRITISGDVRMPQTRLFGQSTTGFDNGESDLEVYDALIESEVRAKLRHPLSVVIRLRCKQLFGFIPEHLDIKFKPLRTLSAEQEENIKDKKFNRASALFSQGILTGKEYCELLKKEEILTMKTEVSTGAREPEPPQAPLSVTPPKDMVSAPESTPKTKNSKKLDFNEQLRIANDDRKVGERIQERRAKNRQLVGATK